MLVSIKEIAKRWGVSETWVSILCKQGRVSGAVKNGHNSLQPMSCYCLLNHNFHNI